MHWTPLHQLLVYEFYSPKLVTEAGEINKRVSALQDRRSAVDQAVDRVANADPMTIDKKAIFEAVEAKAQVVELLQEEITLRQAVLSFTNRAMNAWSKMEDGINARLLKAREEAQKFLADEGFSKAAESRAGDVHDAVVLLCSASDACLALGQEMENLRNNHPVEDNPEARRFLEQAKNQLTEILRSVA